MKSTRFLIAAALAVAALPLAALTGAPAWAQSTTSGAIQGVVKDAVTSEALAGVTVVASSSAMQGTQTAITDENGFYKITNLPPGTYLITFYYADVTVNRDGVNVGVQKTTPVFQSIRTDGGEVINVIDTAPTIDPTSTTQGITLDQEYTRNIPVPGRTFDAALGAAAGSQGDGLGVAFSGSTSLENQYYVDGVNTTGLKYGTVGNPVVNDFIEEIEVITGGYNAEYGRATGGVVNVVTKSGSNELEGGVFAYYTPGQLVADIDRPPNQASSIDAVGNLGYAIDFGAQLGGPIIKDRLWYFVGIAPAFARTDITRSVKRRTDCRELLPDGTMSDCDSRLTTDGGHADTHDDIDPTTGYYITDPVDSRLLTAKQSSYSAVGKLNFAVAPEHQGQVSIVGAPASGRSPGVYGMVNKTSTDFSGLVFDSAAKWTSKFNDNKTEVEGVVGWHRETFQRDALNDMYNDEPFQTLTFGNLGNWSHFLEESQAVIDKCIDGGAGDPYPRIDNCPDDGVGYSIGGPGVILDDREERRAARLSVTERLKAFGNHEIKGGVDLENNLSRSTRLYSGGVALFNEVDRHRIEALRWVQLAHPADEGDPRFDNVCRQRNGAMSPPDEYPCDFLGGHEGDPGTTVLGNTVNWGAYLRDSWQIVPNLTLNAGVRYEEQRLRYAEEIQGTVDPLTATPLGKNAMVLDGMFAPRIGLLYDWTREGRSKVYGHWGRFYESIPMDINERSFGGEVQFIQDFNPRPLGPTQPGQCGLDDSRIGGPNGLECVSDPAAEAALDEQLFGASGVLVAPGIKAQYLDEIILGVEYEIMEDLKLGVAYQNRSLGRVIEDVSTDGAQTYLIANPGEWSPEEEAKLVRQIELTDDENVKKRLEENLALFRGIRTFDKPRRDYNALQFTATRRFSKAFYMQGSYTYSRTKGNFPGLISYDNGQVDPNISSQYDLIERLANRDGPLPQDRPHYIKVDGYYTFDLKKRGAATIGARFRALSGVPIEALAPHYRYGADESFLLPRGYMGRTDFEHGLDLHLSYGRDLGHGMTLEVFTDLFNVYNRQGQYNVDETWARAALDNNVNPVVGGSYEDLIWTKTINEQGSEPADPQSPMRNRNFRNTAATYSPFSARFGMRLDF